MHYRLLILFTLVTSWSWGQDTLSLDRVWQEGLANNFDVAIARQSLAVLENNREYQWLTYTPELTVDAGLSARTQDVSLTFASGDVQERAGAGTFSGNAGATVSYRVFEGMGKKFRIQSTQLTETQGEHALEAQMEATVANLTQAYYALVVARNQARVLQTTLALSRERVSLAQAQYQVGKASKLEYLQAQVDYNADSSQWLAQQELVQAAAIQLNQMMARDPNLPVIPVATIPLDTSLKYDVLLAAMEENPALHVQDVAIELAQANERLAATGFYPTLDASLNYGYNYSDAEAGFVLQNRTSGVSGGLTLRWSLSGTLDARRQVENALLQSQTAQLTREQLLLNLQSTLATVYNAYTNQQAALGLEIQNVAVARENVDIALERYRVGKSNALQLREAQRNLVQAENRLLNVRFRIKQAEVELLRISGMLMQ